MHIAKRYYTKSSMFNIILINETKYTIDWRIRMKLTPELLQKIIDDYEIQNHYCPFTEADVIQVKMACSIYNQAPATDELAIEWLKSKSDNLDFCHSKLSVECINGTYSHYDYKETDDVLRMALHYGISLGNSVDMWLAIKGGHPCSQFTHENPALAIMGCIAKLNEKAHAYAS